MSDSLNKLKEQVKALFDKSEDAEVIKQYAAVKDEIAAAETEEKALLDKNSDLLSKYKEAVLNAPLPPTKSTEEQGGAAATKSLEQIASEVLAKKGK